LAFFCDSDARRRFSAIATRSASLHPADEKHGELR